MKWGKAAVIALAGMLSTGARADSLNQQYEKAYYLETARNNAREAAAIYKAIADNEATEANQETIKKSLLRLLHIGTVRKHQPTIQEYRKLLLQKTDIKLQELIDLAAEGSEIRIPSGGERLHCAESGRLRLYVARRK